MGTRGLTKIIVDGEAKVAQYGQWDHYAEGQGKDALHILREIVAEEGGLERLAERTRAVHDVTDEEEAEVYQRADVDRSLDWITNEQAARLQEACPWLSRDHGAQIIRSVYSGEVAFVWTARGFEKDRLFCEGVIEVDLDQRTYTFTEQGEDSERRRSFPLEDLPTDEEFMAAFPEED